MRDEIFLRRRGKVVAPTQGGAVLPLGLVATASRNLERLGYAFSPALMEAFRRLDEGSFVARVRGIEEALKRRVGAHVVHAPMYPGFPKQVMRTDEAELYLNALVHYLTDGRAYPSGRVWLRLPFREKTEPKLLGVGAEAEFEAVFATVAGANAAYSPQDRDDLAWFVREYGEYVGRLLPEAVRQKENVAYLAGLLMGHTALGERFVRANVSTATDVLRLAAGLSGGDVSLAEPTKFRSFARRERRLMLSILEAHPFLEEELARRPEPWKRLGERLHPGESKATPRVAEAFRKLRSGKGMGTFASGVERALEARDVGKAAARLRVRPGEMARRLDHLLRLDPSRTDETLATFAAVASEVSTPVLLALGSHFVNRPTRGLRVFFPKGEVAKTQAIPDVRPPLSLRACEEAEAICRDALVARFAELPPLGACYLDERLREYPVPFALRSASRSLRTVARGSRLPLPDKDTLRFFVWWTNGVDRTDVDLSAAMFDASFKYKDVLSYYNLKGVGGCHSGDIVDAPKGASEYIDVSRNRLRMAGTRYVAMVLTSYTQQPYVDLPECFAGWMARKKPNSGEVYEPRAVQDRLDLTANTRIAVPVVFDLDAGVAIWTDLALRRHPAWVNNVEGNLGGLTAGLRAIVEMRRPTLYDLCRLHVEARGRPVASAREAQTVFSVEAGLPFEVERILAELLR